MLNFKNVFKRGAGDEMNSVYGGMVCVKRCKWEQEHAKQRHILWYTCAVLKQFFLKT
jgi:hypothetical protein